MLRNEDVANRYQQKVADKLRDLDFEETDNTRWNEIIEVVTTAAREVCGVQEKVIENPWMRDKDEEVMVLRARINRAINRRDTALENARNDNIQNIDEVNDSRNVLKEARKDLKRKSREWEVEWWENILEECKNAGERRD